MLLIVLLKEYSQQWYDSLMALNNHRQEDQFMNTEQSRETVVPRDGREAKHESKYDAISRHASMDANESVNIPLSSYLPTIKVAFLPVLSFIQSTHQHHQVITANWLASHSILVFTSQRAIMACKDALIDLLSNATQGNTSDDKTSYSKTKEGNINDENANYSITDDGNTSYSNTSNDKTKEGNTSYSNTSNDNTDSQHMASFLNTLPTIYCLSGACADLIRSHIDPKGLFPLHCNYGCAKELAQDLVNECKVLKRKSSNEQFSKSTTAPEEPRVAFLSGNNSLGIVAQLMEQEGLSDCLTIRMVYQSDAVDGQLLKDQLLTLCCHKFRETEDQPKDGSTSNRLPKEVKVEDKTQLCTVESSIDESSTNEYSINESSVRESYVNTPSVHQCSDVLLLVFFSPMGVNALCSGFIPQTTNSSSSSLGDTNLPSIIATKLRDKGMNITDKNILIAAIGPTTKAALSDHGISVDVTPMASSLDTVATTEHSKGMGPPTVHGMIQGILNYFSHHRTIQ